MKERILYHICDANISYGNAVYHIAQAIDHFLKEFEVIRKTSENIFFVAHRQKLVVFSYIRLTASYMHLRCVIFASQVICLRALGANIISLKP